MNSSGESDANEVCLVDDDLSVLKSMQYLLASDGLTHEIDDEEISKILAAIPKPPTSKSLTAACEALITAANRNGGHDNITVLLVGVTPDLATA